MKKILGLLCVCVMLFTAGCSCKKVTVPAADAGEFDASKQTFGFDKNVNMETIDKYLNLENVAYRDMRLLIDSQGYDEIGGAGMLTETIEGFRISPLPYIANLWEGMLPPPVLANPVEANYTPLYTVVWNDDGSIASIQANYVESQYVLEEIFPKDKLIFLICGGGGYASELRLFGGQIRAFRRMRKRILVNHNQRSTVLGILFQQFICLFWKILIRYSCDELEGFQVLHSQFVDEAVVDARAVSHEAVEVHVA